MKSIILSLIVLKSCTVVIDQSVWQVTQSVTEAQYKVSTTVVDTVYVDPNSILVMINNHPDLMDWRRVNDSTWVKEQHQYANGFKLTTNIGQCYSREAFGTYEYIDSIKCIEYDFVSQFLQACQEDDSMYRIERAIIEEQLRLLNQKECATP